MELNYNINNLLIPKSKEGIVKLLSKLSKKKRNIKLIDASRQGKLDIVKLLIEYGVDVNFQNEHGTTALRLAYLNNHIKIIKLLEKYEAKLFI